MSQAKRRHVLAASKWREQVARELAVVCQASGHGRHGYHSPAWDGTGDRPRRVPVVESFDVHAAREHARSLIALEDEQRVFEDWTRARGLGPENREPGAFDCRHCQTCLGAGKYWAADMSGTEAGFVRCHCEGDSLKRGGWPGKLARQWHGDSRAPMGRAYARLGRRIIDALDVQCPWAPSAKRQPSECQECRGGGAGVRLSEGRLRVTAGSCPDCGGTGHNLRGVLPAVENSAQLRRKLSDSRSQPAHLEHPEAWARVSNGAGMGFGGETRTVARGQHRDAREPLTYPRHGGTVMRCQVDSDGYIDEGRAFALLPRWRRGELRHAEQRREQESRDVAWARSALDEGVRRGRDANLMRAIDEIMTVE